VIDPEELARAFMTRFGRAPRCIHHAPGRVNLIGEHTDYNDGFVMPVALDRSTWVAAAARDDRRIVVRSEEMGEEGTFDLDTARSREVVGTGLQAGPDTGRWTAYVRGVATLLESAGADLLIASDVPIGAGLSSSAALEVACAGALVEIADETLDRTAIALLCQRAEHEFAGTRCGVMDQMIACYGREGTALLLDTRTLERTFVPVPDPVRIVVCNTMVRHELASGEYNRRRADCETGVEVLRRANPGIAALRDATIEQLDEVRDDMSVRVYARCHHVITENDRVLRASDALGRGDLPAFGALMAASHASLRDDYEVSSFELDAMVDVVVNCHGVYGARMTGGGFGGCVVALADARADETMCETIRDDYESATGRRPDVWITAAGAGLDVWSGSRA